MRSRMSFDAALTSIVPDVDIVDRRLPSRFGPEAASTPQPRPHSDFIPGVTDDHYVAAWRKRGPVTLLNASSAAAVAVLEEVTPKEIRSENELVGRNDKPRASVGSKRTSDCMRAEGPWH